MESFRKTSCPKARITNNVRDMTCAVNPRLSIFPQQGEAGERVIALAQAVREAGGRLFVVGGGVRDALLQQPVNDVDTEVFGLSPPQLEAILARFGRVNEVGKAFSVYKLSGVEVDVSLPRRETKTAPGHRGFAIVADPHLAPTEAAARRDFTINALLFDPLNGALLDPYGGEADLRARRLRHPSPAFAEDPLRVLRGMQFIARFDLTPAPATVALCRGMTPEGLPVERIGEEWRKFLVQGHALHNGLRFLEATGWLQYFPELAALHGCPQDPRWHPEGDAWTHTAHCLDAFAQTKTGDAWEDWIVGLAVLCHDLGKATHTLWREGRWRSPGHESAGEAPSLNFLRRLTAHEAVFAQVVPLVVTHMRPAMLRDHASSDAAIRRLARAAGRLDRLARVVTADAAGRPPLDPDPELGLWLLARADALALRDRQPKPIIQGRHLIALGQKPGPDFGPFLHRLFEAQLDGTFTDEAGGLALAQRWLTTQDRKLP